MKVVFVVGRSRFLRAFASAIGRLASAGHCVHIVADGEQDWQYRPVIERLRAASPQRITDERLAADDGWRWHALALWLRQALDAWHYLDRRFDGAPSLRHRAVSNAPGLVQILARCRPLRRYFARVGAAVARRLERTIPPRPAVEELLQREAPDAVLVTPLLYFGSAQVDVVRAARRLGLPTALCVGSWDHLTSKGVIHAHPDRVFVWNEAQRAEADACHGIAPERVVVTGAPGYDEWFNRRPARSRSEFCAEMGFADDRPFLLYVCSAPFITPYEVGYVLRLIDAIRRSADDVLAGTPCLIRPHPLNLDQWGYVDLSRWNGVRLWPRKDGPALDSAISGDSRYYDAVFHSAAVIGVNTSALIEAGIVGRPVHTLLADEFAGQQEGTLHFQHLKTVSGGLLHVAVTLDEHLDRLAEAVRGSTTSALSKGLAFAASFIRPHGLDAPASQLFVGAVEALQLLRRPTAPAEPFAHRAVRPGLSPLAGLLARRPRPPVPDPVAGPVVR